MARIRTIKPELPEDEALGRCSRDARLLFVLALTKADDYGRLRSSGALLKGQLFAYDDDLSPESVDALVQELVEAGPWVAYAVRGERYVAYRRWRKHQRIDNRGRPLCPAPPPELGLDVTEPWSTTVDGAVRNGTKGSPPRTAANRGEPRRFAAGEGVDLDLELDLELEQEREQVQPSFNGLSSNGSTLSQFERLWNAWPLAKRTRQPEARKAWADALAAGSDPAELTARALAWCAYWAVEGFEARYIPRPGTWLRDSRDDPVPATTGDARRQASLSELRAFLEGDR